MPRHTRINLLELAKMPNGRWLWQCHVPERTYRSFREVFRKMSRDAIAGPVIHSPGIYSLDLLDLMALLEAMQAAAVARRKKAT